MKIGYIGLGKMGKNMVLRLLDNQVDIVAWNRSSEPVNEVAAHGAAKASTLTDVVTQLPAPRIIFLMLPAGSVSDEIMSQLLPLLSENDYVIDGANAFYKDTLRHHQMFNSRQIHFIDVGVSGGPGGARNGACVMAGGSDEEYEFILPLLVKIAAPTAVMHVGPVGAGHFVKMVHNGIEYGMMEAIAEGAAILEQAPFPLRLSQIFSIYNNKSVIESRLVAWTQEALTENPELKDVSSTIAATGEGEWTVSVAHEEHVETPVIEAALSVRKSSANQPENFRNKLVSALRGKFGQHKISNS